MKFFVSLHDILVFLAVFLRVGIVLFILPFFKGAEFPMSFKGVGAFFVSLLFYIPLASKVAPLPAEPISMGLMILSELIFGIAFSLALSLVLSAFEVAGEIISFQMGFGFAQVADPLTGVQVTVISRFFQLVAALIFFSVNGHLYLIRYVYESFEAIPVGSLALEVPGKSASNLVHFSTVVFSLAFKVAAPIILVLFITELGMGFIVKFAPQINILVVSFALTIIIGIIFAVYSVEGWAHAVEKAFKDAFLLMEGLFLGSH